MKTKRFISVALVVLGATSCNKDYISETHNIRDIEPMTLPGLETKTIFTPTTDGGTVFWTSGDELAIYDNLGGTNIFNLP